MAAFDISNEQAVLAAALCSAEERRRICATIPEECFLGPAHRVIYGAVRRCDRDGMEPDLAAVAAFAGGEEFGGPELVERLLEMGPPANLSHHVRILRDDFARFEARKKKIPRLDALLADKSAGIEECWHEVVELAHDLRPGAGADDASSWKDTFGRWRSGEGAAFIPTGIPGIDEVLTVGFIPGNLSVIAARPSMGKSSLAVEIAIRHVLSPPPRPKLLVGAVEMGKTMWVSMAISRICGIPFDRIVKEARNLSVDEVAAISHAHDEVLFADDSLVVIGRDKFRRRPGTGRTWTNADAVAKIEDVAGEACAQVCMWDMWSLLMPDRKPDSITDALWATKDSGAITSTHHVLLHHLGRSFEKDKKMSKGQVDRPTLEHLKGSGGWEEVGDLIFLLHREKHYMPHLSEDRIEINVAKQRNGPRDIVFEGMFDGAISRISDVRPLAVDGHQPAFLNEGGPF